MFDDLLVVGLSLREGPDEEPAAQGGKQSGQNPSSAVPYLVDRLDGEHGACSHRQCSARCENELRHGNHKQSDEAGHRNNRGEQDSQDRSNDSRHATRHPANATREAA